MRNIPYFLLFVGLVISCTPLQEMYRPENHIPSLGDIGKYSKSMMHTSFHQIGNPSINNPIAVSVKEVLFCKSDFRKYSDMKEGMGEKPAFFYADSVSIQPKYLNIEITDKIGMRTTLNSDINKEVLAYVEQDKDYRMVYRVSTVTGQEQSRLLTEAEAVFLVEDRNGQPVLEIIHNKNRFKMKLSDTEIFDYKMLGFCWGENQYGQKRISAFTTNGEHCPKNTERKASKLDETKSYLKL